jgi:Double zinc ribbon
MPAAIFGIENDGLNLAANLFVLMLVVLWLALIAYTYFDARRRVEDPVLVLCSTAASLLFPYIGTAIYVILRPPEFLEDAHERELEIKAAELRVRQLAELSCPNCGYPVEKTFLRCPSCQRRLKDPCQGCGKPVDPRWALCPYCETPLPGRARQPRPPAAPRAAAKRPPESEPRVKRGARKPPPPPPPPPRPQTSRRASALREADGAHREREGEGKS